MNRISLLAACCCILLASSTAFSQSRGSGSSGGFGGGSGGSGSGGFGGSDIGSDFSSQMQNAFGDTSQFGQTTGINALSSGIGSPATGLGLPPLSGSGSSSTSSRGRTGSPNSTFGSISSTRGASGGGLSGGSSGGRSSSGRSSSGRSSSGRSVTGMTGSRSPGRAGGAFGMNGMTGMNGAGRNNRTMNRTIGVQQSVRPVYRVSFEDVPVNLAAPAVTQMAAATFAQNQALPSLQQMQVNVDTGGVATIRGAARNDHERALAAALLSLEPGVRGVRNEIAVTPQSSLPGSR